MSIFGNRLKNLRLSKGESQEKVADLMGIQRATYSGYERGVIVPPYERINTLAEHFEVSVDFLMGKTNVNNYEQPTGDIPDIADQLRNISDELLSDYTVVNCNGDRLTKEEKKLILPYINGCINFMEILKELKKELK
ncbi:MAG: helix-turn-helix domain-containing protein [Bullifex sp.]